MKKPASRKRAPTKPAARSRGKSAPKNRTVPEPGKRAAADRSAMKRMTERLREAEETLDAIRSGHVDALVIQGSEGEQVFTLKGADHRYRQLVETMNEGALMVATDGTIVYGNARFAALMDVELERMIGTSLRQYVAESAQLVVDALLQARDGSAARAEVELVAVDGARVPVYLSATAGWDEDQQLTCVIVTDLTDQKRTREMLAAERLTSQIVDQAAEGIIVCDLERTIVRASQAAHRLTGGNPLLRPFEDVFMLSTPTATDIAEGIVDRSLRGETTTGYEVALTRPGNGPVDLLLSAGPIIGSDGLVLGCVISFVEITERKRAAEERLRLLQAAEAARAQAENANRAKDEFLAMLGHELRNPLAPIMTALDLMNMRPDETYRRERDIIERQVKHVVTLVGDLLDVSRIARGRVDLERRVVDLARVIDKAIEAASPLIDERRHRIAVDVPAGLWVDGDEARLCQVFSNLLTNAAKYTPRGGSLSIATRREGDELVTVVRDNGSGISPELLTNLFDLFVQGHRTLERAEGGLGLGLAIVRSLVSLHGGRVEARSDGAGQGSEFEVRLPAVEAVPAGVSAERGRGGAQGVPRRRVLVVDDNSDAAAMLAETLETLGHDVRLAHDGPSALEVADRFQPEVAVLDIGLPAMDGYELARRLRDGRASDQPLQLIAVTGYGRDSDREHAMRAGFDHHMVKPIDVSTLESVISGT